MIVEDLIKLVEQKRWTNNFKKMVILVELSFFCMVKVELGKLTTLFSLLVE